MAKGHADKFIMHNNTNFVNPEIELSFQAQNEKNLQDQNRLNMQMLRVHATEKQRIMNHVWELDEQELCEFFRNYHLFPQDLFSMQQLFASQHLKLIKNDGVIYFGLVERKMRTGNGILISKDGRLYEGEFYEHDKHGGGIEIYENGNLFIGSFLNNKKHGTGKFYWFSLMNYKDTNARNHSIEYYEGEWWGGLPDGQGIHQKVNGDLFVGCFKNGLKHGTGSEHYGNGDYYKGEYVNGLPEGFGEYLWGDGSFYKGDFKQGLRSGYGFWCVNQSPGAENYQGHYQEDKKSGYGVYEWENGWIYKGNFENDYRHGYGELYDGSNLTYKGYWANGQQIGKQKQYSRLQYNKAASSLQLSRSKQKGKTEQIEKYFSTIDVKEELAKLRPSAKLSTRPQFSIKKRPRSLMNEQQKMGRTSSSKLVGGYKKTQEGYTTISSMNRPILKISNPIERSKTRK